MISKFAICYRNDFTFSASFAFDPVRKINFRIDEDIEEWRVGGSWLTTVGIFNFDIGRNVFEDGGEQTNYSIGTFVPLSKLGITPLGIQVFPMAGYTNNDGDIPCDVQQSGSECANIKPTTDERFVLVSHEARSGYFGFFALKKLGEKWNALGSAGGSIGTDDYSGYWAGGGIAYQLSKRQSLKLLGHFLDNSYGTEEKLGVSYSYQFN